MKKTISRDPSMDVIRCFALLCVIAVHFFLNIKFYDSEVAGPRMVLMTLMRTSLMVCVPLFILLSGYLMCRKAPNKAYYAKISKTIVIYILASLCCLAYKWACQDAELTLSGTLTGILAFTAAPYSWYIEMYLGLFLIIPFLNILYNNIPTQRQKQLLLVILLVLTALPGVLNVHNLLDAQWWLQPASSTKYNPLVPDWWTGIYPITYYFIGCYLREYPLKLKTSANIILIAVSTLVSGLFCVYRSWGRTFLKGAWQNWGSILIVIPTVLVFTFFQRRNYSRMPQWLRTLFARLSEWSLGAYLVSWVFDQHFYGLLNSAQPDIRLRLNYFPLIVPAVWLCSNALSAILNFLYTLLSKAWALCGRSLSKTP